MENVIVTFIPEDFIGNSFMDNEDCPLARACSRALGYLVSVGCIYVKDINECSILFQVKEGFFHMDYEELKDRYKNNPDTKDFYTVELIPVI